MPVAIDFSTVNLKKHISIFLTLFALQAHSQKVIKEVGGSGSLTYDIFQVSDINGFIYPTPIFAYKFNLHAGFLPDKYRKVTAGFAFRHINQGFGVSPSGRRGTEWSSDAINLVSLPLRFYQCIGHHSVTKGLSMYIEYEPSFNTSYSQGETGGSGSGRKVTYEFTSPLGIAKWIHNFETGFNYSFMLSKNTSLSASFGYSKGTQTVILMHVKYSHPYFGSNEQIAFVMNASDYFNFRVSFTYCRDKLQK